MTASTSTDAAHSASPTDGGIATFGAGCFWGVEQLLSRQPGVTSTAVGCMGGPVQNPTSEWVCTDTTEHAEVVQVTYDPSKISYAALIDVFR